MEAEDLLDKFAQGEGFGNWETVVLNCHHSVIRSVAIAAVNEALRQTPVSGLSEQLPCEHRSYRAGHSPFVPCICNDCGEEL